MGEIIAAVIMAIGTISGAVLAAHFHGQKKSAESKVQQMEDAVRLTGAPDGGLLVSNAAYTIARLEKLVTLEESGAGTQVQRWIGLKPGHAFENLQIPFHLKVEGPDVEIADPHVAELEGSSLTVQLIDLERVNHQSRSYHEIKGKFLINGHCRPGTHPVSFEWHQNFVGFHRMTREQALLAYGDSDWKQEYTASIVVAPTAELTVEVRFPESFSDLKPRPHGVVFIGGTHVVHHKETERIASAFSFDGRAARLAVTKPVIGLAYAICWMPPLAVVAPQPASGAAIPAAPAAAESRS